MFNTLLVEDDISYRQALSDILLLHFPLIGVDEAGDGKEALTKVEYLRPELIFMDIHLPGKNGLDVTREIKRVYNDIVIVILTRSGLPEYRQQAYRNGADYFLSKEDDYCLEDILTRVDIALTRLSSH
ncbi:MAG: response regulator [Gammaproteobacteria bacterium]|jgi:DNA-binding NarL/FixJ family response regulator|nr:response regulator [Gammaproteobacteria bacterium]